jgi:hypothetical protein
MNIRVVFASVLPLVAVLGACGGSEIPIGKQNGAQSGSNGEDGGAASGTSCTPGARFRSPDGCNTCTCPNDGVLAHASCTEMWCADASAPTTCSYNGVVHQVGEAFPCVDGCNTCGCMADGSISTTFIACDSGAPRADGGGLGALCGGFAGLQCASAYLCVDDPTDTCDPAHNGNDCSGVCIDPTTASPCGGVTGLQCPSTSACVDDPRDTCSPPGCGGLCVRK